MSVNEARTLLYHIVIGSQVITKNATSMNHDTLYHITTESQIKTQTKEKLPTSEIGRAHV